MTLFKHVASSAYELHLPHQQPTGRREFLAMLKCIPTLPITSNIHDIMHCLSRIFVGIQSVCDSPDKGPEAFIDKPVLNQTIFKQLGRILGNSESSPTLLSIGETLIRTLQEKAKVSSDDPNAKLHAADTMTLFLGVLGYFPDNGASKTLFWNFKNWYSPQSTNLTPETHRRPFSPSTPAPGNRTLRKQSSALALVIAPTTPSRPSTRASVQGLFQTEESSTTDLFLLFPHNSHNESYADTEDPYITQIEALSMLGIPGRSPNRSALSTLEEAQSVRVQSIRTRISGFFGEPENETDQADSFKDASRQLALALSRIVELEARVGALQGKVANLDERLQRVEATLDTEIFKTHPEFELGYPIDPSDHKKQIPILELVRDHICERLKSTFSGLEKKFQRRPGTLEDAASVFISVLGSMPVVGEFSKILEPFVKAAFETYADSQNQQEKNTLIQAQIQTKDTSFKYVVNLTLNAICYEFLNPSKSESEPKSLDDFFSLFAVVPKKGRDTFPGLTQFVDHVSSIISNGKVNVCPPDKGGSQYKLQCKPKHTVEYYLYHPVVKMIDNHTKLITPKPQGKKNKVGITS